MKEINLEHIFYFLKKKTVIIIGVILFLLSSLITITQGGDILLRFLNESVRHKEVLYNTLKHLSTETNISYFESLLGKPIYINSYKKVTEYIFVNDLFYVQGITDKSDKILAYSVTTTDRNFNPIVPFFEKISLGKSEFKDIKKEEPKMYDEPEWIISYLGAHDLFYTEGYYMANPGGYQSIFFSITSSGYIDYRKYITIPDYESPTVSLTFNKLIDFKVSKENSVFPEDVKIFRNENTNLVNTYTVLGPFIALNEFLDIRDGSPYYYLLGPDYNQVRLMNY